MSVRLVVGCALLVALVACAAGGEVRVDGSSTVYPISLAVAEEFSILHPQANVSVSFSGTGGGLSKLCTGEIDIAGASRVIEPSELATCAENGIDVIELPIAADAITVVVHPDNDWVECLDLGELRAIWEPASSVTNWSDVRTGWPAEEIVLFGPGTDSGTFDYFTEAVNGMPGATRTDFFPSEDDNVLVQGVRSDRYALGYFGFAHYAENTDAVRAVAVDGGAGCTLPKRETIEANAYSPLSRPLFVYVATTSLRKEAVAGLAAFYLGDEASELVSGSGYVAYPAEVYRAATARLREGVTGSAFLDFEPGDSVLEAVRAR